jgi:hypothetical protein
MRTIGEVDGHAARHGADQRAAPAAQDGVQDGIGVAAEPAAFAVRQIANDGGSVVEGLVVATNALFILESLKFTRLLSPLKTSK